jgi:transcriptional regulator NrdR family protein|tara:strand:- start:133 stop:267 length:135 start_codon:yes stop_codon:yes gene_type:complete
MQKLMVLDIVAFIRFASVYEEFNGPDPFGNLARKMINERFNAFN